MGMELAFVVCNVKVTLVLILLRRRCLHSHDAPLNFLQGRAAALMSRTTCTEYHKVVSEGLGQSVTIISNNRVQSQLPRTDAQPERE